VRWDFIAVGLMSGVLDMGLMSWTFLAATFLIDGGPTGKLSE
jgi:hypothetical protein